MKKIFAIALALVMVLSMASAFAASDCAVWGNNWPCSVEDKTPWCGQGKIEVVPLVAVNTACGWEYQVNECAGAVRSKDVAYALKLTVDAYPDRDWWSVATLLIDDESLSGVDVDDKTPVAMAQFLNAVDAEGDEVAAEIGQLDMGNKKEAVYYAVVEEDEITAWIDVEDWDDEAFDEELTLSDFAIEVPVPEAAPEFCKTWPVYEVCATLASFYDGASNDDFNKLGDYFYSFGEPEAPADLEALEDADPTAFDGTLTIWSENSKGVKTNEVTFLVDEGAIVTPSWADADDEYDDNDKFYNKVMDDFGFGSCGTAPCVTMLNIFKNFGWNDSQEDCFEWSDKAAAVVDAECVVAIPKTGDASLLAWLF